MGEKDREESRGRERVGEERGREIGERGNLEKDGEGEKRGEERVTQTENSARKLHVYLSL